MKSNNKKTILKVGTCIIELYCNNCPLMSWAGENISHGDQGYRCEFGGFSRCYDYKYKIIPKNCPLMVFKI